MQPITVVVLACLVAAVAASVHAGPSPAEEHLRENYESVYDAPEYERSSRTKRGLLLLKKKLLLGALGLKVAKVGAVGAGVAGVVALKKGHNKQASRARESSHSIHPHSGYVEVHSHYSHEPKYVKVHSWSG